MYNEETSASEPVVSGVSDPFEVLAGEETSVTLYGIPENPESLTESVASDIVDLVPTVQDFDNGSAGIDWGEEAWFSIVPTTGRTKISLLQLDNSSISQYVKVFDQSGMPLNKELGVIDDEIVEPTVSFSSIPGRTYYLGALDFDAPNGSEPAVAGRFLILCEPDVNTDSDGNTSAADAAAVTVDGEEVSGSVDSENDADYFTFETVSGENYTIPLSRDP